METRTAARPRWRRVPVAVADGVLAGLFALIAVVERLTPHLDIKAGPLAVDVPMTITVVGLLALRRIAPVRVLLLSSAVIGVPTFFVRHDFLFWSHMLPLAIQTYTVGRHRGLRVAAPAALAPVAAIAVVFTMDGQTQDLGSLFFLLLFVFAVAAGVTLRRNAEERAALADALARLAADRLRRERLAVLQERARVARDLQTVVERAVTVMLAEAGTAAGWAETDPDRAEHALLALETAGRGATGELRRMLGLLRADPDDHEDATPAPGLAALDGLIEAMRGAGLDLSVRISGERPALPPGFDVTAYRILQEALLQVVQRTGPTRVQVQVEYGDDLTLEIRDAGPLRSRPEPGDLIGVRERVRLLGGELAVTPEAAGVAVRVRLPVPVPA